MKRIFSWIFLGWVGTGLLLADTPSPTPDTKKEPTIITSEHGEFDSQKRIATLEGKVLVVDPSLRVTSKKMIIFFDSENKVIRIEAFGEVVIQQQDKVTHSDEAVYTPGDGKVILTGNPSIENPQGTIWGQTITFYRDDRKVFVEKAKLIIKGGKAGLPELFPSKKPETASPSPKSETKP